MEHAEIREYRDASRVLDNINDVGSLVGRNRERERERGRLEEEKREERSV